MVTYRPSMAGMVTFFTKLELANHTGLIINPFPHIDASVADGFLKIVTQGFPLLVKGYPFNYRYFLFFDKISLLLQNCCIRERVNKQFCYLIL